MTAQNKPKYLLSKIKQKNLERNYLFRKTDLIKTQYSILILFFEMKLMKLLNVKKNNEKFSYFLHLTLYFNLNYLE